MRRGGCPPRRAAPAPRCPRQTSHPHHHRTPPPNPPLQGILGLPIFTNAFYKRVLRGDGFFKSDDALVHTNLTLPCVQHAADDQDWFFEQWVKEYREMTWWGQAGGNPFA